MKHRYHSPDFNLKVVKKALEIGNNAMVARKHELSSSMISKWVRTYKTVGEKNFLGGRTSQNGFSCGVTPSFE